MGNRTVHIEGGTVEQALEMMKSFFYAGEEIIFGLPNSYGHEFQA